MIQGLYNCFEHWHKQGTVWIYSDPHFADPDQKIMDPNWISDEEQLKLINSKVGKNDTFICLGDCGKTDFIKRIKGYKILIKGNHDLGTANYTRKTFNVYERMENMTEKEFKDYVYNRYKNCKYKFLEDYYESPRGIPMWRAIVDNCLFDEVYSGPVFIGEKLVLSHEPIMELPFAFNIHGHVHGSKKQITKNHFNCCANVINYTPINFNQWMKQGYMSDITSIHRMTIDKAITRKNKKKTKSKSCY